MNIALSFTLSSGSGAGGCGMATAKRRSVAAAAAAAAARPCTVVQATARDSYASTSSDDHTCTTPSSCAPRRRALLALGAAGATLAAAATFDQSAAAAAPAPLHPICSALSDPSPKSPGLAWALTNRQRQLFYPPWLVGDWTVSGRFAGAAFPLGRRFLSRTVPGALKASMAVGLPDVGAGMDSAVMFRQRFVEDSEQGGVVADRVFNTQQLMDTYLGYTAVTAVTYAPLDNPTRMAVIWTTPRKRDTDQQTNDLRKAEIFINNRGSSGVTSDSGVIGPFCCFELYRQVTQAKQQGAVGDYASWWEYSPVVSEESRSSNGGSSDSSGSSGQQPVEVSVRQRVAAFLQPQDPLYFDTGDRAVALYAYNYTYTRVTANATE